jgi:GxxExxY protein
MPCLQYELAARKLRFVTQQPVPLVYKGMILKASYRLDLVVEDTVVVEVKSVASLEPVHDAQASVLNRELRNLRHLHATTAESRSPA